MNLVVPEAIIEVLSNVKSKLPSDATCVLAGGALRDLVTDRPISDYDIFIHHSDPQFSVPRVFGATPVKRQGWTEYRQMKKRLMT